MKSRTPAMKTRPASGPVGERARGKDQRAQRQRVGVDDPLQAGQAGIEALLHVRQRNDHDRDVEGGMNVVTQTASSVHFLMPPSVSRSIPATLPKPPATTTAAVAPRLGARARSRAGDAPESSARSRSRHDVALLRVEGSGPLQRCADVVRAIGNEEHLGETRQRVAVGVEEVALRRERHRFTCECLGRHELTTVRVDLGARGAPEI